MGGDIRLVSCVFMVLFQVRIAMRRWVRQGGVVSKLMKQLVVIVFPRNRSLALMRAGATFYRFLCKTFCFRCSERLRIITRMFRHPFPMSTITRNKVNNRIFCVMRTIRVPMYSRPGERIVVGSSVVVGITHPINVLTWLFRLAMFFQ